MNVDNKRLETKLIHAGQGPDPVTGALSTPIFQTSTFCFDSIEDVMAFASGEKNGYIYTRSANPTTAALEEKLRVMEGGEAAICTASGMGAVGSTMIGLLKTGDHVISTDTVYGGTDHVMRENMPRLGIEVSMIDTSNLDLIKTSIKENTKVIYIETPTNPTMKLTDIKAVAEIAKAHNIKLVVDNTFAPPPIQYPLELGADIVIHSTTKYINGHGDVVGGAVIGSADDIKSIKKYGVTKLCGTTQSPFNSYLILRGMKTMYLRVKQHCENAMEVAKYLENREEVARVLYPGLESHPQHELAKQQMNNMYTGIFSFELKDGINGMTSEQAGKKLIDNVKMFQIAVSLGDPDSLIEHPSTMTHDNVPREERLKVGITDGLIRVSIGLENVLDIIDDFEQAFKSL